MREIKFRVWAKSNRHPDGFIYNADTVDPVNGFVINQFGNLVHVNYEGNGSDASFVWARIGYSDIHIMQFTGLRDKNGVDVYEGDILHVQYMLVSNRNPCDAIVEWDKYRWCMRVINADDFFCSPFGPAPLTNLDTFGMDIEVIGNIYETPELMKSDA